MRIALVSPYSWTFPGGVSRHIEALAQQYMARGHDVRVISPYDPVDAVATLMHRGAHPQRAEPPDYLVSLGRTVGFKANGSVSNVSITPAGMSRLVRELHSGNYDVVHVHEPIAPLVGWVVSQHWGVPLVGTFHSYSTKFVPNMIGNTLGARQMLNHLHVRIAVSEAAAWTGRRWYGGRYRVIPNGVSLDREALAAALASHDQRARDEPLRILFVGQAVERKGLPLLLRAFEALREHIPTQLTVIGPTQQELAPLLMDARGVRALGKIDDATKCTELQAADVLAAPSLGGESFGMVLTEAFATGTTVVASDIAGYRDVVTDGTDGVLVAPGDAQALAEALRDLYHEPDRRLGLARAAAETVQRFAWENVATDVMTAYLDAIATPAPAAGRQHVGVISGFVPADLKPRVAALKLESLERPLAPQSARRGLFVAVRRATMAVFGIACAALAYLALQKIGIASIGQALINSSPSFVLIGLAAMCSAMVVRGVAWHAILLAALPNARVKLADALQGTMIGVLMSSTLPARLGEPAKALVVARRIGRPRETLPAVAGTLVSQTLLNILALMILGVVMFSTVDFFSGHQDVVVVVVAAPLALLAFVLLAPVVLRHGVVGRRRFHRLRRVMEGLSGALRSVRSGLNVFRNPRLGAIASGGQLTAWALQWLSCFLLLRALGLQNQTGLAAAAAVLFAVNVTAVVPVTPANVGVFQAACATVLQTGWHIGWGTGVAYGVVLQAVEVATALLLGMPALLKEGMSWREVRLRAIHSTPIRLPPRPGGSSRRRTGSAAKADA